MRCGEQANEKLKGPSKTATAQDTETLRQRVALFTTYKDFIDQQKYAEKFDSRSNLHSSVLEEFIYYLFRDLVGEFTEKSAHRQSAYIQRYFLHAAKLHGNARNASCTH